LLVLAGLKMQDAHSACLAEGTAQPIQVATRILGSEGALDSAACRGEECMASIAVGENRSGSSQRRLMDSVVAPYLRVLDFERLVDTNVGGIREMTLIARTTGLDYSRRWV